MEKIRIIWDTYIYNIDTVLIVEIMGRNAGWLTAAAHLASETDIDESICLGKNGVKLAMEGRSGVMSTTRWKDICAHLFRGRQRLIM